MLQSFTSSFHFHLQKCHPKRGSPWSMFHLHLSGVYGIKCEGVRSERWSNSKFQDFFSRHRQAMSIPSFFPRTLIAGDSQQKLSRSSNPSVQKEGSRNSNSPNVWKTHRARKENTSKVHLVIQRSSDSHQKCPPPPPQSCFIVFSFWFMKFD